VRVARGVAGRTGERLSIFVGNVLARLRVLVALAQSKINEVDLVLCGSHKEVVGLHVAMDEVLLVHVLEAGDHLLAEHAGRFKRKLAVAKLEQILE
jgi:hypothetical protein